MRPLCVCVRQRESNWIIINVLERERERERERGREREVSNEADRDGSRALF